MSEAEAIPIEDVVFDPDAYPRVSQDDDIVRRYRDCLDELPPITIDENNVLVDGYHRMTAHRAEGRTEIEAERVELNGTDVLVEAARMNSTHGHQLDRDEKKVLAKQWYREGKYTQEEIADILSLGSKNGQSTVSRWCEGIDRERRKERQQKSPLLYLDYVSYPTYEDVAEEFDYGKSTIERDVSQITQMDYLGNPPDSVKWDNVWRFSKCDPEYGMDWPGRIPGQIVENLLWHYTEPFDLVIDPMAGGGTTVDVCKAMYRRFAAFDINPVEGKSINQHDTATDGIPIDNGKADLVFMDPPYWRIMDDEYAEGGISQQSHEGWLGSMCGLLEEAERVTQCGGHLALLIEPLYDDKDTGAFQDLTYQLMRHVDDSVPTLEQKQRIATPMNHGMKSTRDVEHAKENGYLLDLHRDLVVWEVG